MNSREARVPTREVDGWPWWMEVGWKPKQRARRWRRRSSVVVPHQLIKDTGIAERCDRLLWGALANMLTTRARCRLKSGRGELRRLVCQLKRDIRAYTGAACHCSVDARNASSPSDPRFSENRTRSPTWRRRSRLSSIGVIGDASGANRLH